MEFVVDFATVVVAGGFVAAVVFAAAESVVPAVGFVDFVAIIKKETNPMDSMKIHMKMKMKVFTIITRMIVVPDLAELVVDLAVMLVPFDCLDYLGDLESVWVDSNSKCPADVVAFAVAFWIAFVAGPFVTSFEDAKQNSKSNILQTK